AIPAGHSLGAYHLSPDGRIMAVQTATLVVQLWTVDLESGIWTQRIDAAAALDTIPLTGIRWSPDGQQLFAVTEVYPHPSTLMRIDLADDHFEVISPAAPINISPWLDVSPDGRVIAHGESSGSLTLRDTNGMVLTEYPETLGFIGRPIFSADGKFLAYQEHSGAPNFTITI